METILKAIETATHAHRHQTRKADKTPYIIHPIRVMNILCEAGVTDTITLSAAALHDTVEDTDLTFEDILEKFGMFITAVVQDVTNDSKLSKSDQKRAQITKASIISHPAKLIKLADMIDNLTDLTYAIPPSWSIERAQGYFVWKKKVFESGLKGHNDILDKKAMELFNSVLTIDGKQTTAIPDGDLDEKETYLNIL